MSQYDVVKLHPPASRECGALLSVPHPTEAEHVSMLRSFFRRHLCEGSERPLRNRPAVWTLKQLVEAALASRDFVGHRAGVVLRALELAGLLPRFEDAQECAALCAHDRERFERLRAESRAKRRTRYSVSVIAVLFEHGTDKVLTAAVDDNPKAKRILKRIRAYIFVSASASNGRVYLLVFKAGTITPAQALIQLIGRLKQMLRRGYRPAKMLLMAKNLPQTLAEALRDTEVFDENVPVFSYCDHPRYHALAASLEKEKAVGAPDEAVKKEPQAESSDDLK